MHNVSTSTKLKGKWLLIDAAGPSIQIGILDNGVWLSLVQINGEALNTIFSGVDLCLKQSECSLSDISGYLYGSGPGSTLGIRVAAMAIESWQSLCKTLKPIYTYTSIRAAVEFLSDETPLKSGILLAPWKRGWFSAIDLSTPENVVFTLAINDLKEKFKEIPVYLIQCGRMPKSISPDWIVVPYVFSKKKNPFPNSFPFLTNDHPQPYTIESPAYQKWSPQRHGAS